MVKDKIKNASFGSILIGFLTVGMLGFTIYNLLSRLNIISDGSGWLMLFIIIGGILGIIAGLKYPISTEALSFAFTSLIMIQSLWDSTYDISNGLADQRVFVGIAALIIFSINIFTGKLKSGTAKKQIKRSIGAR